MISLRLSPPSKHLPYPLPSSSRPRLPGSVFSPFLFSSLWIYLPLGSVFCPCPFFTNSLVRVRPVVVFLLNPFLCTLVNILTLLFPCPTSFPEACYVFSPFPCPSWVGLFFVDRSPSLTAAHYLTSMPGRSHVPAAIVSLMNLHRRNSS